MRLPLLLVALYLSLMLAPGDAQARTSVKKRPVVPPATVRSRSGRP